MLSYLRENFDRTMVLVLDIGNTRIKAAVYEQDVCIAYRLFDRAQIVTEIAKCCEEFPAIAYVVVSNVGDEQLLTQLKAVNGVTLHVVSREMAFPFTNAYRSPETLGIDRMVLAAGAVLQFPGQARLVIDAGTCITYDWIDGEDVYRGGAISPGVRMRYRAMHEFTARLPLLEPAFTESVIGQSTAESMHIGGSWSAVFEIQQLIALYEEQYGNFIIILTGGDSDFLSKRLKNTIFANANFLTESLYRTFQFQSK